MKQSKGRIIFNICNYTVLLLTVFITLYPLLYVVFASLSDPRQLVQHRGFLSHPAGFSTIGYEMLVKDAMVLKSFGNSFIITVSGVIINMILTVIGAYFLSRKNVYWKKTVLVLILFTMYFNGGLIPTYLLVKNLKLYNTFFALILPGAINTTNLIIMRTAFMAIPASLEESARMDGAGHLAVLWKILLPLAKPTIAVLVLYYGVAHWNSWFSAMIYLKDRSLYPLQMILREKLILNQTFAAGGGGDIGEQSMVGETMKYAIIVLSSIPMLVVYPFVQKHFVKGVMIGAIKG